MSKRIRNVRAGSQTTTSAVIQKGGASRNIKVTKGATAPKGRTLFFFQQTPAGKLLRAYFVAMVMIQCGAVKAGAPFKLWPYANVAGHLATGRMKRGADKGTFVLTQSGVNYLTGEEQKPDKDTVAAMVKAVKSGERPSFYKFELSEMKL
jgi:hypothetical protein